MEQKLDSHLFRTPEEEENKTSPVLKGVATAGGALYAGSALKRGLSPLVADRRAGMRAMIPGFTQKSGLAQTVAATGTVLKDKPLAALRSVGGVVARDAGRVGKAAGMVAGQIPGAIGDTIKGAGMMGRDLGGAIVSRLKGLAGRLRGKV